MEEDWEMFYKGNGGDCNRKWDLGQNSGWISGGKATKFHFHGLIFHLIKLYSWPNEAIPIHNQSVFLG